jgi:hypothetical protein
VSRDCRPFMPFTPHAKYDTACTINERFERPWKPLKGISIENIYVIELSYLAPKKRYKFKGATLQKFSCMLCHWHRMNGFCVRKSSISRRIRRRIQKGFNPWITLDTVHLNAEMMQLLFLMQFFLQELDHKLKDASCNFLVKMFHKLFFQQLCDIFINYDFLSQ